MLDRGTSEQQRERSWIQSRTQVASAAVVYQQLLLHIFFHLGGIKRPNGDLMR